MRILTTNLFKYASMSSSSESSNYPMSNIIHPFLQLRWQPYEDGEQTGTAIWTTGQSVNCIALGYIAPSISRIDIKIYDSGLLETLTNIKIIDGFAFAYFSQTWTGVKKIEIIMTGAGTIYIGGASCGIYYQAPDFLSERTEALIDNSINNSTLWGNSSHMKIPALDSPSFSFAGYTIDTWKSMKNAFMTNGSGGLVWIDFFERNQSLKRPGYYAWEEFSDAVKNWKYYSWRVSFKEAK